MGAGPASEWPRRGGNASNLLHTRRMNLQGTRHEASRGHNYCRCCCWTDHDVRSIILTRFDSNCMAFATHAAHCGTNSDCRCTLERSSDCRHIPERSSGHDVRNMLEPSSDCSCTLQTISDYSCILETSSDSSCILDARYDSSCVLETSVDCSCILETSSDSSCVALALHAADLETSSDCSCTLEANSDSSCALERSSEHDVIKHPRNKL